MTTQLTTTHHSSVTEDQIDHLGHMNVRFYGANAVAGGDALVQSMVRDEAITLRPYDAYTRHHREQLLGSRLVVRSGVLAADETALRLYHELANEDMGVLAATFVHRCSIPTSGADGAIALPAALVAAGNTRSGEIPAHGASRSININADPHQSAPTFDEANSRGLAMRKVRAVSAEECDGTGAYILSAAPMLTWGGESATNKVPEMLHDVPGGIRMGWASMETRHVIARLPRLGDRVQSFSAVVRLEDKTSQRMMWVFDVDSGELLTTFEIVNLAFDIEARAAMSIPAHIRAWETSALHADLAPR